MAFTTRIYANTLAKYNEGKLLSTEKLRRLADADFESAVKMLCDYGYGDSRLNENSYDVDKLIAAETARLIDFVANDCPDKDTVSVLLAKFYYNNAKARYKFRIGGSESVGALYDIDGDYTVGIASGNYSECPEPMAQALSELDAAAALGKVTPAGIDAALGKAMFADMHAHARRSGRAVAKYVSAKIDFVNLTSALRALRLKRGAEAVAEMFIGGGTLSLDDLTAAYSAGLEGFADKLRDTEYYDVLKKFCDRGFGETELSFFNGDLENMVSFAPFLHYYAAALNEFKTVKIILTCLKNNVREEINRRVRWA